MRRRAKPNRLISYMNVVPYIDVMLVLLIIFMVTAPMFVPGVINLPSVAHASTVNVEPIEISINSAGDYSITRNNVSTNARSIEDLISRIVSIDASNSTPVVISADKNIQYNKVITVVDKLYSSGIKKVALVVKEHKQN